MMKKYLILLILLVFLLNKLVISSAYDDSIKNNIFDTCNTPICQQAIAGLLNNMDPSINPCDDFYKFSCGKFSNSSKKNYFDKKERKFVEKTKKIIEQNETLNDFKYLKIAKDLYKSCNDSLVNITNRYTEILNSMEPSGGWPVLKQNQWNESEFNFNKTIFKVGNTTQWNNYFFEFEIDNFNFSSIHIKPIYSLYFTLDDFIEGPNNTNIQSFKEKTIKKINRLGVNNSIVTNDIDKVINFEIALGRTTLSKEQKFNPTIDQVEMTLNNLTNDYSFFNWEEYITYLRGTPVDPSIKIVINNFSYMKKLKTLLNLYDKKTQANYVMLKHLYSYLENYDFVKEKACTQVVFEYLSIATVAIWVENYIDPSVRMNIFNMISNIKKQYHQIIEYTPWIDNETKIKLEKKIESCKFLIGYSDEFLSNSIIDKFYDGLDIYNEESFFDKMAKIDLFYRKFLLTLSNDTIWAILGKQLIQKSATFSYNFNTLVIPFTYFDDDFIHNEKPDYMNYGALGYVIGHGLTRSIDTIGIKFDENNNFNEKWLTLNSIENLNNRTKCFVNDQYYQIINKIAEIGGLKSAYFAYTKKLKSLNGDKEISNLSYNSTQLFWISYANVWCDKNSYDKSRVIDALSNMLAFSDDFKCPIGSKMNPIKKCTVW
ncbi:neprilysin-1-like [Aphidius gifuensis]|uniref:neprilysin-1-like n=1 Tax=Aphidius gifuensis TaxID=684658 RepID=UPI001CDD084C|nr:neprilysin-1-like [Aphidius gifuensis]